jgi:hypothetical protein
LFLINLYWIRKQFPELLFSILNSEIIKLWY